MEVNKLQNLNDLTAKQNQNDLRMAELVKRVNTEHAKLAEGNKQNLNLAQVEEVKENIKNLTIEFEQLNMEKTQLEMEKNALEEALNNGIPTPMNTNFGAKNQSDVEKLVKSKELLNAYAKAMKGDVAEYNEMVKTVSTTATDGETAGAFGTLIPEYVANEIQRKMVHYGALWNHARKIAIKGLYKLSVEVSATGAEIHKEGTAAPTEEEIVLDGRLLDPEMIKKWITWTDEIEIMSGIDLINYLTDEFIEKIMIKVEYEMLYGAADQKGLEGIVTFAKSTDKKLNAYVNAVNTADATGAKISYIDLLKTISKIRGTNIKWFMRQETFYESILSITDTSDRPIWASLQNNGESESMAILGRRVEFSDAFSSVETASVGDAIILAQAENAYTINHPDGMTPNFIQDPYSLAESDKKKLVGKLFSAGTPSKLNGATVLLKGSAA